MKWLLFVLFSLVLFACDKPDPNPELKDPIYSDIQTKLKQTEGDLASEKKNLDEAEADMKKAVPQTGQIRFAEKHYYDVKNRIEKLQQLLKYYKLRQESRKTDDQDNYLKAFEKKRAWPDPQEYEDYKVQESARTKSRIWSVKDRIQQESAASAAKSGGEGGSAGEGAPPAKE